MNSSKTEFSKRLYLPIVALVALLIVFRFATIVSLAEGTGTGTETDPFTTEAAIVAEMRNQLKAGNPSFTLYYSQSAYDEAYAHPGVGNVTNYLGHSCLKHTGVCDEGDYLRENIYTYGWAGGEAIVGGTKIYYVEWYDVIFCSKGEENVSAADHVLATNKAIDDAMASLNLTDSMSDYEKAKAVYDYVRLNVTYDKDALDKNLSLSERLPAHSTYNAIVLGQSVCQGYASLLYNMMLRAGLDCRVITGDAGGAHAWNIVKIGDKYYNCDVTFDSDNGTDNYFLRGSSFFSADHVRDDDYKTSDFLNQYPVPSEDYARPNEGVMLNGCYVGVGGNIFVSYGFAIPETLRNNQTKVVFTFPNDPTGLYTQEVNYTEAEPRGQIIEKAGGNCIYDESIGGYRYTNPGETGTHDFIITQYNFMCSVPASRLSDAVQATVYVGSAAKETYPISVKKFADVIIEDPSSRKATADQVAFLKALLNYGSYSQLYFNYNTTKLANAMWGDTVPTEVDVTAYDFTKPTEDIGITYYGTSLLFKSNTIERHYFNLGEYTTVEQLKNDFTFTIDGQTVEPVIKEDWFYIQKENVAASDLDEAYNVTVTRMSDGEDITFNYSALNYVKLILDKTNNSTTKALMRAIYDYNRKAEPLVATN